MSAVRCLPADAATAIDGHDLTGDERRIGCEEQRGASDICSRARAFQCRSIDDFLLKNGIGNAIGGPHHRARRDRVDANMWAEFAGQRFRQHDETGFGNRVGWIASQRSHAVNVDDIQNQAVRQAQRGCRSLREEQGCFEIRADQVVPVFDRDFTDGGRVESRCVVDQDVELPKVSASFFDELAERGNIEKISGQSERTTRSLLFELGAQFLSGIDRPMMVDDHVSAGRVQLASNRRAHPSCAARDQGNFAGERLA